MKTEPLLLISFFSFVLTFLACDNSNQTKSQPTSPVVSADGVQIDYLVQGSGDVALVFVHGWACDKTYWKEQIPVLSQNYKVVTVDLGGHGESGQNRENWTMDAFGQDVATVVNELELEKVILIGHSMGGRVIVEAAQLLPSKIISLIGVDTWTDLSVLTQEQAEDIIKPFKENFVETTKQYVKSMFLEGTDTAYIELFARDMAAAPPEVAISAGYNYQIWNPEEEFGKIEMPLKLIYAADRLDFDESELEPFGIDVKSMAGVGHFLMMEDPVTFNQLLNTTVKEIIK